jgi:hypothetical protein
MLEEVDLILELLATDKAWHSMDELARISGLSRLETADIVDFLSTHKFVLLNTQSKKARIKEDVNRFLEKTRESALTR